MAMFGLAEMGTCSHSTEALCPGPQTIRLTQMDAASHEVKSRTTTDPTGCIEVVFASVLYKKTIFRRLQGRAVDNMTGLTGCPVPLSAHTVFRGCASGSRGVVFVRTWDACADSSWRSFRFIRP